MARKRPLLGAVGAIVATKAALLVYRQLVGPWQRRWGSTVEEAAMAMPGDELIDDPTVISTRAITIDAPPATVWPWLVQIGQGRAGFYSHDWIENLVGLDIHSADRILDEHQVLSAGDAVSLGADGAALEVERVEPERLLVLRERGGNWTWAFLLQKADRRTRLIVRNRWTTAGESPRFRLIMAAIDPAAFIMERKMLLGIRARVEGLV